ncbi:MAG TPA: ATP-dependent DNA helicase [Actinomycetota bacterium]|nr:ATP-dependent DNA helicase [Actinomycetota bacterium]
MLNRGPLEPDPTQSRALAHDRGGLLVTGPPGSGKTVVLRERLARLVEAGTDPERVGLFVLHRRAVREAREQLLRRLARSLPALHVFTVHGFAFRVLGRRFPELDYAEPPQILSAPEQYALVRELLVAESERDWPRYGSLLAVRGFAQQVADFVLRAQERLLSPDALDELVARSGDPAGPELTRFYRRYLDVQSAAGRLDYAGLLFQTVILLERDLSPAEAYEHLLVDDYQDATPAGEAILRALAPASRSLVVAGDPDGHVFGYRGSSAEPLSRAREALGCTTHVRLERSHRVDAASLAPLEDPTAPAGKADGSVVARLFAHPGQEAEAVAHEILRLRVEDDVAWERIAVVLRRYGSYLTTLRHALARHGIPFVIVAEEAAVASEPTNRPVIGLFRYVYREELRDDLLESLLSSPIGGMHPHGVRRLRREARVLGLSLRELVERGDLAGLAPDLRAPIQRFRGLLEDLPGVAHDQGPDGALFWLWERVPAFHDLVESGGGQRDLDALSALGNVLAGLVERRRGATLPDYLDTLEAAEFGPDPWIPPEERHPHAVRVVAAHRAHGMEFDAVLVPGCLEGEFPSLHQAAPIVDLGSLLEPASPRDRLRRRLAEERRLFRLTISRATGRTVLLASHSTGTRNARTPSRFAARLGLTWSTGDGQGTASPTSLRALEAALRRRLADGSAPPPARLAAAAALPSAGARPATWWGRLDWTDNGKPLRDGEIHTSYSRLSTLENCALQFLYAEELGLDPERSYQMWLGSLVHGIIDRVNRRELPRDAVAIAAALDEAWDPAVFPNRAIEHRRRLDAEDMLRRWLDHEQADHVHSEVGFRFPIDGATMRGRIDAVFEMQNGNLRIVDYKTSRYPPTDDEVKDDLQLAAYYLALRRDEDLRRLGGDAGYLELAFLGAGRIRDGFVRKGFSPKTRRDYEETAERRIRDLLDGIREERFAPNPEANCDFCNFKTICPRWPQGAEVAR